MSRCCAPPGDANYGEMMECWKHYGHLVRCWKDVTILMVAMVVVMELGVVVHEHLRVGQSLCVMS
jgi:hypothetical protein